MNMPTVSGPATRRAFLKTLGMSGLLGLGAVPLHGRAGALANDYNVLWLMSDEHNPFVAGYAGDRVVKTPALDSIAAAGTEFSAAYTPDPICVPSRMGFASGRMSSNLDADNYEAMGTYFSRMGFDTAWYGKRHWEELQNQFGDIGEDCGQVARQRFVDAGLPYPEESRRIEDASIAYWGTDLNQDTVATEQALAFLDRIGFRRFFLGVSFVKPHFPFCIQPEYHALYASQRIRRPKVTPAMLDDLSTAMKQDRLDYGIDQLTNEQTDFCRAIYYGMVSYMDEQVGQVLARLDALGLRDKTIVVYMADHGEMLGGHGIWYKNAFFEASARVPMLVSLPPALVASPKARVSVPVNTIDLYPTLCELCGLPPPATLEGRSLAALITGADAGTDRVAFSENKRRGIAARMIRTRAYKYCYYADGVEQMYDMSGPDRDVEGLNLAHDPAYAQKKAQLKRQALKDWNPDGLFDDNGLARRRRVAGASSVRRRPRATSPMSAFR